MQASLRCPGCGLRWAFDIEEFPELEDVDEEEICGSALPSTKASAKEAKGSFASKGYEPGGASAKRSTESTGGVQEYGNGD